MRCTSEPDENAWELAKAALAEKPVGHHGCRIGNHLFIKMPREILCYSNQLGAGTYTSVHLAVNRRGKKFALKFSRAKEPSVENEVKIEEKLGLLVDSCVSGQCLIRAVPYLGISLDAYVSPEAREFNWKEVLQLIFDCLQAALDFSYGFHPAGLPPYANCRIGLHLHRDIKPANIVVDPETGKVSVIDFGFSRETFGDKFLSDILSGTLTYVAPELKSRVPLYSFSSKTEIFALGVTLGGISSGIMHFKTEADKKCFAPVYGLIRLMCAEHPELRPSLELVKLAVLIWGSLNMSREELAEYLVKKWSIVTDVEEAFAQAVILLNANQANFFSEPENFNSLLSNVVLREMISLLFARREALADTIPDLLKFNSVKRLSPDGVICRAYINLKRVRLSYVENTQRLFKDPNFSAALGKPNLDEEEIRDIALKSIS